MRIRGYGRWCHSGCICCGGVGVKKVEGTNVGVDDDGEGFEDDGDKVVVVGASVVEYEYE